MTRITELLAQRMERIRKGEKADAGFTLIELLVVVIIIGILAAIAIPVFLNQRQSAWKASVQSDVHNATLAVETYSTQNNGSITTLSPTAQVFCGATPPTGCSATPASSTVLSSVKVSAGNQITVTVSGSGSSAKYTVAGTNANLSGAQSTFTYDSSTGAGTWNAS